MAKELTYLEKVNKWRKKAGREWAWVYKHTGIPATSFKRKASGGTMTDKEKKKIEKLLSK